MRRVRRARKEANVRDKQKADKKSKVSGDARAVVSLAAQGDM
jgi:hypothetical protein